MKDSKYISQLNHVLAHLEPTSIGIRTYIENAGIPSQHINFNGTSFNIWNSVLKFARKQNKIDDLLIEVLEVHPNNPYLKKYSGKNYLLNSEITDWEAPSGSLEKLTLGRNTILPINFFQKGINASKAVAKVEVNKKDGVDVGTGFLIKLEEFDKLYFITNNHVIDDKKLINRTTIIFDYEYDSNGNSLQSTSFKIKENGDWFISDLYHLDFTICELDASVSELEPYKAITVKDIQVEKDDFVNIIHHPGGEYKSLSIYHNLVTHTTDRIIHYLTATLPGSSGAPVFNSDWDLVALHHSGGIRRINEPNLPMGVEYRNEGIQINEIYKFLKKQIL